MNLKMTTQTLFDTAKCVFENAAFALADPDDMPAFEDAAGSGLIHAVSVDFSGPVSGVLVMTAPDRLARIGAANMLGVDDEDPEVGSKATDALKELLNMICGNLLPNLYGVEMEFHIEAPVEISPETVSNISDAQECGKLAETVIRIEGCEVNLAFYGKKA